MIAPLTTVEVVSATRTAVRPCDTELAGWHPVTLAGAVGQAGLDRAGIGADELDEVVVGCADPVGACGADSARAVVLAAGWPASVGGHVIDRAETSGIAAVQIAAAAIRSGQAETVLVIGLGVCSVVPPGAAALSRGYGAPWQGVARRFADRGGLLPPPRLAERAAAAAGIRRSHLNAGAERSRQRRSLWSAAEHFAEAAAIVEIPGLVTCDVIRDWGDTAALPPLFDPDGLLSAASFAPPADCVAALVLREGRCDGDPFAEIEGIGRVAGIGRASGDPFDPTGAVARAVERALRDANADEGRSGSGRTAPIGLDDMDEIAVSEPDVATVALVARELGIDAARVNPAGGATATGHAEAAEELRLITDGLTRRPRSSRRHQAHLLTISAGPTGSAAIVWRRPAAPPPAEARVERLT